MGRSFMNSDVGLLFTSQRKKEISDKDVNCHKTVASTWKKKSNAKTHKEKEQFYYRVFYCGPPIKQSFVKIKSINIIYMHFPFQTENHCL